MSSHASSLVIILENMQSLVQVECSPNLAVTLRIVLMRLAAEPSAPVVLLFGHVEAMVIDQCGELATLTCPLGRGRASSRKN